MTKPASGTTLDTGHSLYTSLEAVWAMLEGTGSTSADSRNGHTLTLAGSAAWIMSGGEAAIDIPTAHNQPLAVGTPFTLAGTSSWSIFAVAKMTADDNQGLLIGDKDTSGDFAGCLAGVNVFRVRSSAGGQYDFILANMTTETSVLVVYDQPGAMLHCYVNGSQIGTGRSVTGNDAALSIDTVGNGSESTTFALVGHMKCCYVWSGRALSSSDASALHTDPYVFFNAAPAATSYTFTGPSSGVVNAASTNFTVTPNGTSTATVTPATTGSGTFTPTTVTFDGTAAAKTFTYTPTSTSGSPHTLSVTNSGGLTDPASIGYTVTTGSIACTDLTAGRIYQRSAGTTAKTISFAGTYSGSVPNTVEIRIVAQDDAAVIQDWTTIGSPSISGGNWSGTLSVSQGGKWCNFLARGKDIGGAVLFSSGQTANKWGVGIIIGMLGQSNMANMQTVSSTPPSSSDLTREYESSVWRSVTGNGGIRFANQLQLECSLLVAVVNMAVAGQPISAWTNPASGNLGAFITALNEIGGDCEFILWHQGESDAIAGTLHATYQAALDTIYSEIRTQTGRSTTTLQFGVSLLGNISDGTATDATTDAIRKAQQKWITETTGAFFAGSSVDMVRTDSYHWTAPYYERMGRRYAQAIANQLGDVSFGADGPVVASALRTSGSADIRITVTHDGGTAIEELDGSTDGGSLTGWLVSSDNFATTLTISSTSFSAGKIILTLSAIPADVDTVKVRYQYGENPTITNPVYDDTVPQSDSIGLPLQPAEVTVSVTGLSLGNTDLWFRLKQIAVDNGMELIEQ